MKHTKGAAEVGRIDSDRFARRGLLLEDLHHGLVVGLVDLGQGLLKQWAVLIATGVKHLVEAESGVAQEDLSVLQPLVVVGDGKVKLMRNR